MFFEEKFRKNLDDLLGISSFPSFLLAVSGGVDSMVLLDRFISKDGSTLGNKIHVAHINYKLRGKDSDLDQELVQSFCEKNNIKLHIYEVSDLDKKPQGSVQLWARDLRYKFFREIQEKEGLEYLVTAHHLNDQLETFFINLSRGSGIRGLSGIPVSENQILRPLLSFTKEEIYAFAKKNNIPFREDISNQKNDYLRNKIRNEIIPRLEDFVPNFLENFGKSIDILFQTRIFIESKIDETLNKILLRKDNGSWVLDRKILSKESNFVQFEVLKKFGFDNENEILKIFSASTGKVFFSEKYDLLINREELIFFKREKEAQESTEEVEVLVMINESKSDEIYYKVPNFGLIPKRSCWTLDKDKIKLPLFLRTKKEGDIFYPDGMIGRKKVAKFLKDEKLSLLDKNKIRILCDSDDNILGVVPLRQDKRFIGNTIKIVLS